MNNFIKYYSIILCNLRTDHLQELVATYGGQQSNIRTVLIDRAIEILTTRTSVQFIHSYLSTINEMFCSMSDIHYSRVMCLIAFVQRQQLIMMATGNTTIPVPQNIMYRPPPPPYPGNSVNMITRAALPKYAIPPQFQRPSYYANTIQGSGSANNNIQYSSGNYQMAGPSTVASHLPLGQPSTAVHPNLPEGVQKFVPTAKTMSKLKFKNLTFYDVISEIIYPSCLNSTGPTTDRTSWTITLKLTDDLTNIVTMNQTESYFGKNHYPYQYQIRMGHVNSDCTEITDYLPRGIKILVNGNLIQLPPTVNTQSTDPKVQELRIPKPIDITNDIIISPITTNKIIIGCCNDMDFYVIGLYVVKRLTTDILIQKLKEKESYSSEDTKKYITYIFKNVDPDLAMTHYPFSLVCPVSKIRMKIPVKSTNCDHLQCFDAHAYISMNEQKPTWKCPICNTPCLYDDIKIQNYFLDVITSPLLKDWTTKIQILPDGSWKVYDKKNGANTATSTDNIVVELDSDDEESDRIQVLVD